MARKPSEFNKFPFSSVLQNNESEVVAQNIMLILARTGDKFRPLTFEEYKIHRTKDGDFTEKEKRYFEKVIDYCKSEDTAILFSAGWKV